MTPTTVAYQTDTMGGNSGSPVSWEQTGRSVGIHTDGGCVGFTGSNGGTSFRNQGLWNAIKAGGGTDDDA